MNAPAIFKILADAAYIVGVLFVGVPFVVLAGVFARPLLDALREVGAVGRLIVAAVAARGEIEGERAERMEKKLEEIHKVIVGGKGAEP